MVKFIILCTKVIIAAIVALLFSSCNHVFNGIKGDGNVQTEERKINEKFTKISVSRGLDVIVEQSDVVFVEVEADENLLKHITTKVVNGTLEISSDENIYNAEAETVRVKMPVLESVETTSGSTLNGKGALTGLDLAVKASSGSEIELTAEYDNISSESTNGSNITISGKALKFKASTTSGSEIEADGLLANEVNAEATSGSSLEVHPLVSLKASASSGASIDYSGHPKTVVKEDSSGGSVSSN